MQKQHKTHTIKHHPIYTSIHIGTAALLALGMFGLSEVTKFEAHQAKLNHSHESDEAKEDAGEGKKTLRMPINYSDGLRPTTISGA
jgi:hypothetical protein